MAADPFVLRRAPGDHDLMRRTLLLGGLLTVLVAVAAGIEGTTHFAGARWVPHLSGANHSTSRPPSLPRSPSTVKVLPQRRGGQLSLGPLVWVIVGVVAALALILAWRLWARRRAPRARDLHVAAADAVREVEPEPEPEPETLRSGIELALAVLDEQREPADAVVRAWLGLEETAEESGLVRRPAETPTEFTSRIMSRAFADDRAVQTLLRLYLRTRFGNHPATGDDVAAVREALQELVATWLQRT